LAVKKGAQHVLAIDIEEWAYRNALDNIALNGIYDQIDVELGDFSLMEGKQFDIILANINKHIVLGNIQQFFRSIQPGGILIISGILQNDIQDVEKEASNYFFQLISTRTKNDWLCAVFQNV
jgi:ribosomal protein L11 methyltransferase